MSGFFELNSVARKKDAAWPWGWNVFGLLVQGVQQGCVRSWDLLRFIRVSVQVENRVNRNCMYNSGAQTVVCAVLVPEEESGAQGTYMTCHTSNSYQYWISVNSSSNPNGKKIDILSQYVSIYGLPECWILYLQISFYERPFVPLVKWVVTLAIYVGYVMKFHAIFISDCKIGLRGGKAGSQFGKV